MVHPSICECATTVGVRYLDYNILFRAVIALREMSLSQTLLCRQMQTSLSNHSCCYWIPSTSTDVVQMHKIVGEMAFPVLSTTVVTAHDTR